MSKKQKTIRWMKYHGGSTVIIILFAIVACLGGFDMKPYLIALALTIAAVLLFTIEHIFWKAVMRIMGKRFVANILNDPWILK